MRTSSGKWSAALIAVPEPSYEDASTAFWWEGATGGRASMKVKKIRAKGYVHLGTH